MRYIVVVMSIALFTGCFSSSKQVSTIASPVPEVGVVPHGYISEDGHTLIYHNVKSGEESSGADSTGDYSDRAVAN